MTIPTRECKYCGKTFVPAIDDETAQFCFTGHRYAYHNTMRKIERKKTRYYAIIGELLEMRDETDSEEIKQLLNETISELGAEPNPIINPDKF